jgi:hypothetical protein
MELKPFVLDIEKLLPGSFIEFGALELIKKLFVFIAF